MKKRIQFIPELRAKIVANLVAQGLPANVVENCFELWHQGRNPVTPVERGIFEVFAEVQRAVAAQH